MLDYIPSVYQLVGLGFAVFAVGSFLTLFARALIRVFRSFRA